MFMMYKAMPVCFYFANVEAMLSPICHRLSAHHDPLSCSFLMSSTVCVVITAVFTLFILGAGQPPYRGPSGRF